MDQTSALDQFNPGVMTLSSGIEIPPPPTVQPKQPSKFAVVMGKVASVAGNIFLPGFGGLFGNMLGGLGLGNTSDPTQYLLLQERIESETRKYEAISAVLKAKHDACMDSIRNIAH